MALEFKQVISKRVEQESERQVLFKNSLGLRKAIDIPHQVIKTAWSGPATTSKERAKAFGGLAWKFFKTGHSEHDDMIQRIRSAKRMRATVNFRTEDFLEVNIALYHSSNRFLWSVSFTVEISTGKVSGGNRRSAFS